MRNASIVGALALAAALLAPAGAQASLTPGETAVIRQFTQGAQRASAQKVRALVARPDLSAAESAQAMSTALVATPVTDARVAFLHEVLFGPGSAASRNVLAPAVVRGLLARADAVLAHTPDLEAHPDQARELRRIYAFIGGDIAGAGHPTPRAHDPRAGIAPGTYDACSKLLGDHARKHGTVLALSAPVGPNTALARAQLALAVLDMASDSPTRTIDAADRLGLDPARRSILIQRRVLVLDDGKAPARVAAVRSMLARVGGSAMGDVEAVYFGEGRAPLRSRGAVLGVPVRLDSSAAADVLPEDEVQGTPVKAPFAALAAALAAHVAPRVLQNRGELRLAAQHDAQSAARDPRKLLGPAGDGTPESAVAGALGLLLADAPRTLDLALARFLGGRPQSLALVCDALGVLVAAGPPGSAAGASATLGKPATDGSSEWLGVTGIRLAPNGAAVGFTIGHDRWEVARGAGGTVTGVRRNGQPLTFGMLHDARIPVSGGASWSGGGLTLSHLLGNVMVGAVAGPRVRVVGTSTLDAAALSAPGDDVVVDADIRAQGPVAILLRAGASRDGVGTGLRIVPGTPWRVSLVWIDARHVERELAGSSTIPRVDHVRLSIKDRKLQATLTRKGQKGTPLRLEAVAPSPLAHGDVALVARKGSWMELSGLRVRGD